MSCPEPIKFVLETRTSPFVNLGEAITLLTVAVPPEHPWSGLHEDAVYIPTSVCHCRLKGFRCVAPENPDGWWCIAIQVVGHGLIGIKAVDEIFDRLYALSLEPPVRPPVLPTAKMVKEYLAFRKEDESTFDFEAYEMFCRKINKLTISDPYRNPNAPS